MDPCYGECMDRSENCEMNPNIFTNILLSAENSSSTPEVNNIEPTMKEKEAVGDEDHEQQLSPSLSNGSSVHGDSFIHRDVPNSELATAWGEE
jgi:hypothetical protein